MKKRIFAAILAAVMAFSAVPTLLPAADISVSAASSEKLPAPTWIEVVERTDDSVTLLWDSVEGADGYVIYRYDSKTKKYVKLKNLKGDHSAELYGQKYPAYQTYQIEGLKKGKTYRFKIAALVKGSDGKYTVQTKSKAMKVKNVDAPKVSFPPLGMTKTEFFQKYDKNAFAPYFFPFNDPANPFGGYEGKALYRGETVKATVNFDQEGRAQFFSVIREDRKESEIQSECDRLTKKYGEPYALQDRYARWFVQTDQDRGMDIGYLFSDRNGKSEDIIYVEYLYEGADEIGKTHKGNAGQ